MLKYFTLVCAVLLCAASMGCGGPSVAHFGYTSTGKTYYHFAHPNGDHSIFVCDLQDDGSEINCVESEI